MRTTLIIEEKLLDRAGELSGIGTKTALVRAGLEALIAREAGRRLAALGGTQPEVPDVPRRRLCVIVLADTSVWIGHFRETNRALSELLAEGLILMHPCVVGELSCGNLKNRTEIISYLNALPLANEASHAEVQTCIDNHRLWGKGLGWIDAHLLTSPLLSSCRLWTLDKSLAQAATELGSTFV